MMQYKCTISAGGVQLTAKLRVNPSVRVDSYCMLVMYCTRFGIISEMLFYSISFANYYDT